MGVCVWSHILQRLRVQKEYGKPVAWTVLIIYQQKPSSEARCHWGISRIEIFIGRWLMEDAGFLWLSLTSSFRMRWDMVIAEAQTSKCLVCVRAKYRNRLTQSISRTERWQILSIWKHGMFKFLMYSRLKTVRPIFAWRPTYHTMWCFVNVPAYLAQTALLHSNLSVEKVNIIPIFCSVQEMRFWGRDRGRELKCFSAASPPQCMLNILRISTRLLGDLDCLRENGLHPQEVGMAGVFPINSK